MHVKYCAHSKCSRNGSYHLHWSEREGGRDSMEAELAVLLLCRLLPTKESWISFGKPCGLSSLSQSVYSSGQGMCMRQSGPIRVNLRVFAANAGTRPFALLRGNKEAGSPEAAGSSTGSTSLMTKLMFPKAKWKDTKKCCWAAGSSLTWSWWPWTFRQISQLISFMFKADLSQIFYSQKYPDIERKQEWKYTNKCLRKMKQGWGVSHCKRLWMAEIGAKF